ncbi:hypothetical protein [Streptomyces sp. NBC_00645]|uniref:hypothetical protein n=1 Tax=Streptomyces sp. NBC_00645 TaxID=2975795 RepID=UPI0032483F9D
MNDDRDDIQAAPAPTYPPLPLAGEELFAEPDAEFEADFVEFFTEPFHDPASEETKAARFDAIVQRGEELILLEAKNTATQNTATRNTDAKNTSTSSASATAAQPGTAETKNPATPTMPNWPQPQTIPRQTRHVIVKPPTQHLSSTPRRSKSRLRFSPVRVLAQAGLLAGIAGVCVVMTMVIWSGDFSAPIHILVNIPVLVAAVSHHYLRSHPARPEASLEREGRPKSIMRMRSYRKNRERV